MEILIVGLLGLPFLAVAGIISGLFIVKAREEVVVLFFGKYAKTFKNPGIKWYFFLGREIRRISTQDTTTDCHRISITIYNRAGFDFSRGILGRDPANLPA